MRTSDIDVLLSFPLPNYDNPQTRGPALVIVNSTFISFVVIAVALRVYTRLYIKRWFGSDDYLICAALVSTVTLTIIVMLANTRYYWDRHVWDIPWNAVPGTLKVAFAGKMTFIFAATFVRMSLLQFYYRLTRQCNIRWSNWALHLTHAFNACICVAFVALTIFQCYPVSAYWAFPLQMNKCLPEGPVTLGAGIVNCVADLLVASLPIPIVAQLQMPQRQRVGVVILLSLGFIVTTAGIVRTYFIWKSLMNSYDETWFAYPLWIAAVVEIDLAVICACAPAIRPLVTIYVSPIFSRFSTRLSKRLYAILSSGHVSSPDVPSPDGPSPRVSSSSVSSPSVSSVRLSSFRPKSFRLSSLHLTPFRLSLHSPQPSHASFVSPPTMMEHPDTCPSFEDETRAGGKPLLDAKLKHVELSRLEREKKRQQERREARHREGGPR
ncbi:hypothetical protein W97_01882 [Coniosporium apollinis CBS 100218]|uniref:Rhodopsin domain-containing protein n=1 Tax=Coniosporium apollinis (strain CBS 100218) TaxID=1168221 RepID=R7YLB2_CONA1|nr:uncharacterized protein W97_01882 [Coniosporium apollinis CBS 100218]EON62658.1 hypothetical protein W97_01882 [Coniosporium apollinis CBS 100218]